MSLYRASVGESSCGCFGKVSVSPWVSAGIDLLVVAAVVMWRPGGRGQDNSNPGWLTRVGVAVAGLAVGVLAVVVTRVPEPARLAEDGSIIGDGRMVALEPEKWVGKRFPLLRHIDVSGELRHGDWIVVLYRQGCPACEKEVAKYEHEASERKSDRDRPRVALLEVSEVGAGKEGEREDHLACLHGRLSNQRQWAVETPVVLWIQNARVVRVKRSGEIRRHAGGKG
jgi:hypothetical protein